MSAYLEFEGQIQPMVWGDATYTVLPLPDHVAVALRAVGAKRVEGEIADHPVNLAPSTAPVIDGVFLWTGKSLLDRIGIAPGDVVDVRLRPAPDGAVDTPDDLAAALRSAGCSSAWEGLSPGKRRGHLYQIDTAKRPETRAKRITRLVDTLRGGS